MAFWARLKLIKIFSLPCSLTPPHRIDGVWSECATVTLDLPPGSRTGFFLLYGTICMYVHMYMFLFRIFVLFVCTYFKYEQPKATSLFAVHSCGTYWQSQSRNSIAPHDDDDDIIVTKIALRNYNKTTLKMSAQTFIVLTWMRQSRRFAGSLLHENVIFAGFVCQLAGDR